MDFCSSHGQQRDPGVDEGKKMERRGLLDYGEWMPKLEELSLCGERRFVWSILKLLPSFHFGAGTL